MKARKIFLVSPNLPTGATWLVNCFLELGVKTYRSPEDNMWTRDGRRFILKANEYILKKWMPALSAHGEFEFRDGVEAEWVHELPGGRFDGAEILYFIRDPRDSIYSQYLRTKPSQSFREFVRSTDARTGLDLVESWRRFNLCWMSYKDDLPFFRFEDYKRDAAALLGRIVDFIQVPAGTAEIRRACEASTSEKAAWAEKKYNESHSEDPRVINHGGRIGAWRETPDSCEVMAEIEERNRDLMGYFGYRGPSGHLPGTVYWFTGLSGAGKTTLGRLFYETLKKSKDDVIFLDGDELRQTIAADLGHGPEDRKKSAMRNSRLCKQLADQGFDVVCSTISLWHECQEWNRGHIRSYKEIYVRAPIPVLTARDSKKIYSRAASAELKNVWGVDLEPEEPKNPDLVIDNDGSKNPGEIVNRLCDRFLGAKC